MKIAIVTTGDEIMSGNVVDTNSAWIADKCWMLGHQVVWHGGVPDDNDAIGDACKLAADRAEVVFVTGGLGATLDDITVESAAKAFGKKMVFHDEIWNHIQNFMKKAGRECADNNKRQAYLPEGGKALDNKVGTAPGVQVKFGGAVFFFLPGVPRELYQIFDESILPWLKEKSAGQGYYQRFLRCFGLPEATFDQKLKDMNLGDVRMSFRVTFPEVKIKLVSRGSLASLEKVEEEIRSRIGEHVFGLNDETLEHVLVNLLKNKKQTLAVAESCTGGLISNLLTNVPGASEVFNRGTICYANEAKMQFLGVKKETLGKFGAVSRECAIEMAEGIKKVSGATFGLSVTGIAGPSGGTKEKPVGTVHIALATPSETKHVMYCHNLDRLRFKALVAYETLDLLRRHLEKNK